MDLINSLASNYAERFTSADDSLREELLHDTLTNHPMSHMTSGKVQGKLLEMISKMIQPKRILEVGTFTGYSALCLAEGLSEDGYLHTLELREQDALKAKSYFERSNFSDRIILHQGNALEVIPTLTDTWDLVFLDADKTGYAAYFDLIINQMRPGGILLADNVLFHGDVLEEPIKGKNAIAIHAFNEKVYNDARVETTLLTVRDGILLVRKK